MIEHAPSRIVVVGGGPAAMFLLRAFSELPPSADRVLGAIEVVVVEARARFGMGTPYWEGHSLPIHTLAGNQEVGRLEKGKQLERDFHASVARLRERDCRVRLAPLTEIVDIDRARGGFVVRTSDGGAIDARWVVLATGIWNRPAQPGILSPWPAADLAAAIPPQAHVGILGTALTSVDAIIAIATAFGTFERRGRALVYCPEDARAAPCFSLLSRGGYLPTVAGWGVTSAQGDPDAAAKYDRHFTAGAVRALEETGRGSVRLAAVWKLLRSDILAAGIAAEGELSSDVDVAWKTLSDRFADGRGLARFVRDCRLAAASIAAGRLRPLQALVWHKNELFRRCFARYPGEDRERCARHGTLLLAFQQPLNFASAEHVLALVRAARLTMHRLGPSYALAEAEGRWCVRSEALARELRPDVLVDARGEGRDVETDQGLIGRLVRKSLLQPAAVPLLERARHYRVGGVAIDPETCEAREGLFAVGPLARGYYPFSDGLHALAEMMPKVVLEIMRRASPRSD